MHKIEKLSDIANLGWVGNHYSDVRRFAACDSYIRSLTNREEQREALYLMGLYGMGEDTPVSDATLDECLQMLAST